MLTSSGRSFKPFAKPGRTSAPVFVRSSGPNRLYRDLHFYAVGAASDRDTTYRRYVAIVPAQARVTWPSDGITSLVGSKFNHPLPRTKADTQAWEV